MHSEEHPRLVGALPSGDPRDLVYELRKRAVELHTRAARIEAKAWEVNRLVQLERARKAR